MAYLIHGYYQPVHFNQIKYYLTKEETTILKRIVSDEDIELFQQQYHKMYHRDPPSLYSYHRLLDLKDDILELDIKYQLDSVLYGIPKGRINPKEDSILAAIREFKEETGISIITNINPEPITYQTEGVAGGIYQLKCWIYEVDSEIDLNETKVGDTREISNRTWVKIPKVGDSYVEGEFHKGVDQPISIDNQSVSLINIYYNHTA